MSKLRHLTTEWSFSTLSLLIDSLVESSPFGLFTVYPSLAWPWSCRSGQTIVKTRFIHWRHFYFVDKEVALFQLACALRTRFVGMSSVILQVFSPPTNRIIENIREDETNIATKRRKMEKMFLLLLRSSFYLRTGTTIKQAVTLQPSPVAIESNNNRERDPLCSST
jgi:hypothetical protein